MPNALDAERVAHFGAAQMRFLVDRLEQAGHGALDLVGNFVNHRVRANLDVFALRQVGGLAIGPHVESENNGAGRRSQQHVRSR